MRTIDDIIAYATRLHKADPKCGEPVPVSRDEYDMVRDSVAKAKRVSRSLSITNVKVLGHLLKILNEGRGS